MLISAFSYKRKFRTQQNLNTVFKFFRALPLTSRLPIGNQLYTLLLDGSNGMSRPSVTFFDLN